MAKFTKSVRLRLTPEMLGKIRAEAKHSGISASALIRDAIRRSLSELTALRWTFHTPRLKSGSLLEHPLVDWTPAEQQFADAVMRVFREEDR
jgi:predicted DNA-binding protein